MMSNAEYNLLLEVVNLAVNQCGLKEIESLRCLLETAQNERRIAKEALPLPPSFTPWQYSMDATPRASHYQSSKPLRHVPATPSVDTFLLEKLTIANGLRYNAIISIGKGLDDIGEKLVPKIVRKLFGPFSKVPWKETDIDYRPRLLAHLDAQIKALELTMAPDKMEAVVDKAVADKTAIVDYLNNREGFWNAYDKVRTVYDTITWSGITDAKKLVLVQEYIAAEANGIKPNNNILDYIAFNTQCDCPSCVARRAGKT